MQERRVKLLDGEEVIIRPLRPDDAALYADFLAEVTHDDLRLRFFSAMRALPPEMIDKLTHYDSEKAMAFAAIEDTTGRLLGVVRLHFEADGENGEFAILLRSRLKGHGLGWLMMKHIIAAAKARGLTAVTGQVLTDNKTMLQMCGELGFRIVDDPLERGVKQVTLPLADVPAEAMP